ncbi:MAG: TIGR01777 family protein [Chloroflexi bacterium]|nr:TIGR01777 family protein [Chloroflexota bacterium]
MRIIVTGGSGLIGTALAGGLAANGHEVIVLSRSPERLKGLPPGARAERWDGKSAEGWGPLAEGADAIVNLAGENIGGNSLLEILFAHWTPERKRRIRTSRLDAGNAVVQAVELAGRKPKVVVQSSAVGYYGLGRESAQSEDAPPGQDFLARVCVEWEAATAPVESMGVRRVVFRSGVVLTRQGGILPLLLLPFRLFAGGRLGSGRQWFPWVHLDDVVAALRFAIENDRLRGTCNLCAPHAVRNREAVPIISRVLRRPAWLPVPAFALRLLLGEKHILVLDGQLAPPDRLQAAGFTFTKPHLETALGQ